MMEVRARTGETDAPADGRCATSDFDYELPPGRIARYPSERRSDSRLLVLSRSTGEMRHHRFRDLPELLDPGDLLVVNDTRVFPARLRGRKPTGAAAEVLLLRPAGGEEDRVWEALVRPGRKLKPGRQVVVAPELSVRILDVCPDGRRIVRIESPLGVREALERFGRLPLPPYMERDDEPLDRDRYQTVYARREGSVAAPTGRPSLHPASSSRRWKNVALSRSCGDPARGFGHLPARGGRGPARSRHGPRTLRGAGPRPPGEYRRCREHGGTGMGGGDDGRAHPGERRRGPGPHPPRTREHKASSSTRPTTSAPVDCLVTNFHLPRSTLIYAGGGLRGAGHGQERHTRSRSTRVTASTPTATPWR